MYLIKTPGIIVPWRKARFFMIAWEMNNSGRSAKVEIHLKPKSMLCAWITPEGDIKVSLTITERTDCSGQIVQKNEQKIISEEEVSTLKRFFFQWLINLYTSRDSSLSEILVSKWGVHLPELFLQPKRQPGIQMDPNSSELPDDIKKIVKKDTVN